MQYSWYTTIDSLYNYYTTTLVVMQLWTFSFNSQKVELSLISSKISKIQAFKGSINYLEDKSEKVEDYLATEKDKFDIFRQVV